MHLKPFTQLKQDRLKEILNRIQKARVAVMGDFCLDVYWVIDMSASEFSVETNKRTQPVREQRYSLGGAGNVVANLHNMGVGETLAFGIVGNDPFGYQMLSLLKQKSNCDHVLISDSESWQTLAYCKPYIDDEELQRLDMGNFNRLPDYVVDELIVRLKKSLPDIDVVIINQQVLSGIHTKYFQDRLAKLITGYKDKIFIYDGRHVQGVYQDVWLKINDNEALRQCGTERGAFDLVTRDEVLESIKIIFRKYQHPLIVTRGAQGCIICADNVIVEVPGIKVAGKLDPVGAGDSFLAGMAASISCGTSLEEAVQIGNYVAAATITKIGQTGTATPEEILKVGTAPEYN